jgi:serine/threonine-protein kinase HipA
MTTEKLNVFIGDCLVGSITRLPGFQCFFGFDESYISAPDRPTLSQFYLNANGELRIESRPARHKLVPTWFSNLLPEGPLRTYLAQRGDVRPDAEFNLLELLGNDLPGAVRVQAVGDISNSQYELGEEARPAQEDGPMRFSLAGVQLKFSGIKNARGGLTIPASGSGGDWIIKLPSSIYPAVPENEAAMLALAAQVGFNVPEHRLVRMTDIEGLPDLGSFAGNQAIAVKRFDRAPDGKRIHIEDLAQVFGLTPNEKYEKVGYARIAEMIATVIGSAAAQDFVARLVFTTLTGNGDMHLKNWSLIYPDGRTPSLSPAYDLVSTIPYILTDRLALNLAGKKAFTDITKAQFASFAQKAKLC